MAMLRLYVRVFWILRGAELRRFPTELSGGFGVKRLNAAECVFFFSAPAQQTCENKV